MSISYELLKIIKELEVTGWTSARDDKRPAWMAMTEEFEKALAAELEQYPVYKSDGFIQSSAQFSGIKYRISDRLPPFAHAIIFNSKDEPLAIIQKEEPEIKSITVRIEV